jgi:hypothetical protein
MIFQRAPEPAIRLHPMRDLVNRPISRPQRGRAGHLARRDFERSRSRCSWRLGPVRFRRASSQADDGDEDSRVPSKKRGWPLTASAPSAQPYVPRPMSNPKRGSASPGFGDAAGHRRWRAHHARHRVPHAGRGGARKASLGVSGTAAGWKHGRAIRIFREPHGLSARPASRHPASPDPRSRESSDITAAAGTRRSVSRVETLKSRASGVREGWARAVAAGVMSISHCFP